jgi:hypothetical protein
MLRRSRLTRFDNLYSVSASRDARRRVVMANSTSGPLWILDTTGTITTQQVRVRSWKWLGATTAGHTMIVKDGAGRIRFKSVANGQNFIDADAPNMTMNGFVLDTMTSGELDIEVG